MHGGGETKSAGDNEMQSGRRVRLKLSRRGCVSVCLRMSADLPQQAASPFSLYFSLITYFIQITLSATGSCLLEEQRDTIKEKEKKAKLWLNVMQNTDFKLISDVLMF